MKDGLTDSICRTLDTELSNGRESLSKKWVRLAACVVLVLFALCLTGCYVLTQERISNIEGRAIQQMEFNRTMGYHEYYGTWDMGIFYYTNHNR